MGVGTGGVSSFLYTGVSGLGVSLPNGLSIPFPTLDLGFANTNSLDTRITFTRASNATYFDATGVLQTVGNNVARFDHNPTTLQSLGLLIEEQRTNSIRNNTGVGAVAGTPGTLPTNWSVAGGGLTANVIGTGIESGITYIDIQLVGTTSSASAGIRFEPTNFIVASSGQTWTGSFYVRQVGGALTNITNVRTQIFGRTSANASNADSFQSANFSASLSATNIANNRQPISGTLADATTAFIGIQLALGFSSGVAIDITLRIGLPQLEQGAFATSVIPTTVAAATRNADVATMTGTNFSSWYNQSEGTFYSESVVARQVAIASTGVFSAIDVSGGDLISTFYRASGATGFNVNDDSIVQADLTPTGVLSANTVAKIGVAYKANDFAASGNGGAVGTDTSGTVPVIDRMNIGLRAAYLNGHIRRIAYYPVRLSNDQLQALTR